MKELADILETHAKCGSAAMAMAMALATVVRVQGSAYRRPGARMLITGDGHSVGGVSGGCLERDIIQRAGAIMVSDEPALVRYDTTVDGDSGGYSLGCGGTIDILIESLNTTSGRQLMESLAASRCRRLVLGTVISKRHPAVSLGQRMVVDESGNIPGHMGDDAMYRAMIGDAGNRLEMGRSGLVEYRTAAGVVEVFMELLEPPLDLFIFGAGSDAVPLAEFAKSLGWRVTVADLRSAPADPDRVWSADRVIRCHVDSVDNHVTLSPTSAVVVMTHNITHDSRLISWLAGKPIGYLGLLGPRHRSELVLSDLPQVALHSPVGLDIGADNPQEVALAIVAEITAVFRGRSGRSLRSTGGPIHADSPDQSPSNLTADPAVVYESRLCPAAVL